MCPIRAFSPSMLIRGITGAAIGFAVSGAVTWDIRCAVAAALFGAIITGIAGGLILRTTAWAMIGGAMIGGMAIGIVSAWTFQHMKGTIYGAIFGAPLGAFLGYLIGIRTESANESKLKDLGTSSSSGVWDRGIGR